MKLFLPNDNVTPEEQNKAKESGALTLLLGSDDAVYYYEGQLDASASNFKTSTMKQIRDVIIDKKRRTPETDLVVIIKPSDKATYKEVIDILDEMSINVIKRYAIVDILDIESQLIDATSANPGAAAQ